MKTRAIEYVLEESALGILRVAGTARGVCRVRFGESEAVLGDLARQHFPWVEVEAGGSRLRGYAREIAGCAAGRPLDREIPLDVRGSRFQERVWAALREIAHGETRSYAVVAVAIGQPRAVRAVANACASNPLSLVVPCHRVVRSDGGVGYQGGSERKSALLAAEASLDYCAAAPAATSASCSASTRARFTPPSP